MIRTGVQRVFTGLHFPNVKYCTIVPSDKMKTTVPSVIHMALSLLAHSFVVRANAAFHTPPYLLSHRDSFIARTRMSEAASTVGVRQQVDEATQQEIEATVRRYFEGVDDKDPTKIRSCFGEMATILDVCALASTSRAVPAEDLVTRCMEFVTAHPDVKVRFHYGPVACRIDNWIYAHWYETGTWSGSSCGLEPTSKPMAVEGQTRFKVDPISFKIQEFVVTRTFTDWENQLLLQRRQNSNET
jgi:hypothetical protein